VQLVTKARSVGWARCRGTHSTSKGARRSCRCQDLPAQVQWTCRLERGCHMIWCTPCRARQCRAEHKSAERVFCHQYPSGVRDRWALIGRKRELLNNACVDVRLQAAVVWYKGHLLSWMRAEDGRVGAHHTGLGLTWVGVGVEGYPVLQEG
jgi:hypothetical protein